MATRHGDCVVELGPGTRDGSSSGWTFRSNVAQRHLARRRVELGLEDTVFDLVRQGRAAQLLDGFVPGKSGVPDSNSYHLVQRSVDPKPWLRMNLKHISFFAAVTALA